MQRPYWTSHQLFNNLLGNSTSRNVSLKSLSSPRWKISRTLQTSSTYPPEPKPLQYTSSLVITPPPLTLSEDKIHQIIKGTTYSFSNFIVKIFCDKNQLSAPNHATITTDDEMSDVANESADTDSDDPMTLQNVDVPGVPIFFHVIVPASRARFQQPGYLTYVCVWLQFLLLSMILELSGGI